DRGPHRRGRLVSPQDCQTRNRNCEAVRPGRQLEVPAASNNKRSYHAKAQSRKEKRIGRYSGTVQFPHKFNSLTLSTELSMRLQFADPTFRENHLRLCAFA